jgi:hypothetical protein
MAINKNHEFEDLNGIKCAIVEKNVLQERVDFLKDFLEYNGYTVIVTASPPAKTNTPKQEGTAASPNAETIAAPAPQTFTVGVTDVMFNAVNAIFGRMLQTKDKHIVTLAYWQQKENKSRDEVPYFYKN